MQESQETELIQQAQAGDAKAFEELIRAHYTFIFKVAFKWCGIKEDAEDVAQEVCVKLARKLSTFKGESSFQTWLYRMVINTSKDFLEKKRRDQIKKSEYLNQEREQRELKKEDAKSSDTNFRTLIESLPAKLKDAALLVYGEGLNHKEAAKILKCAETTVSWRVFQAKKRLKRLVESGEISW